MSFRTPQSGDPESRNTKEINAAGFRVRILDASRNDETYFFSSLLKRSRAKWAPVRVKKTRQNKKLEPGFDSSKPERL
jgi:hypothetical protein